MFLLMKQRYNKNLKSPNIFKQNIKKQHFFFLVLNEYQPLSVFSSTNTFQQAFLLQFCYNEFYSILRNIT
ncbi:phage holin family protein [Segatella copri]|uniref:phage holin family protein n=2 Tax=Segatella copri TaxID=165179 RepID=UPI003F9D4033